VLADNPSLYWRFGEKSGTTAEDATANNRDGTYGAGVTLAQSSLLTGDADTAVTLNNSSSGVITSAYNPFTGSRTFTGWANRTSDADFDVLFAGDALANPPMLWVVASSTDVKFSPNNASDVTWTAAWPGTAQVVFWALTVNNTSNIAELFINGASQGTKAIGAYITPGNFMVGGTNPSTASWWFNGKVDEVAVYESILPADRIWEHWRVGNAQSEYGAQVLSDRPSLYWRLGESGGAVATDASGRGRHGTYMGPTRTIYGVEGSLADDVDTSVKFTDTGDGSGVLASGYTPVVANATRTFIGRTKRPAAHAASDAVLWGTYGSGPNLFVNGSDVTFAVGTGGDQTTWAGVWPGSDEWVSWALVHRDNNAGNGLGSTADLYINGLHVGTKSNFYYWQVAAADLILANRASYNASQEYHDEFAVFEYELSAARIRAHYNTGIGLPGNVEPSLRLAADRITGLADGAAVATWGDVSGNGNSATQGTGANQPTFQTNELNGKPVVRFDGTNDALGVAGITNNKAARTVLIVARRDPAATGWRRALAWATNAGLNTSDAATNWRWSTTQAAATTDIGGNYTSFQIVTLKFASTGSLQPYIDGLVSVAAFDPDDVYQSGSAALQLGGDASGFWQGDIAEVIVYDTALSDTDRKKVEDYLRRKYMGPIAQAPSLWLKADALALADGAAVSSWTDSSGRGRHATQATGTLQPTFQTNELNGKPVVRFDGGDRLSVSALANTDPSATLIAVARPDSAGNQGLLGWWNAAGFAIASSAWGYNGNAAGSAVPLGAALAGSLEVLAVRWNSTASADAFRNGGAAVSFDPHDSYVGGTVPLDIGEQGGGPGFFGGDIAEVLFYDTPLSDSDLRAVHQYLMDKYLVGPLAHRGQTPSLWLKADAIKGKSDGDAISQWDDSSGNGRHATANLQPTYKTNILNGRPVVRFDGSDWLTVNEIVANDLTRTMFVVVKAGGSNQAAWAWGETFAAGALLTDASTTNWRLARHDGSWISIGGPYTDYNIITTRWNSASSLDAYVNGGSPTSFDPADQYATTNSPLRIGERSAEHLNGDIAEVLIYDTALSDTDLTIVHTYLKNKYGMPI
jgi:hypothetical protein